MNSVAMGPVQPWWRIGMVWLAFGGPALVVLACFVTLFFAVHGRDAPLIEAGALQAPARGAVNGDAAATVATDDAQAPAVQARNHVTTPRR